MTVAVLGALARVLSRCAGAAAGAGGGGGASAKGCQKGIILCGGFSAMPCDHADGACGASVRASGDGVRMRAHAASGVTPERARGDGASAEDVLQSA